MNKFTLSRIAAEKGFNAILPERDGSFHAMNQVSIARLVAQADELFGFWRVKEFK